MKVLKFVVAMALVLIATSAFAAKSVNGRVVPEGKDWGSSGNSPKYFWMDSLFTSLANILPTGSTNSDAIDVDSIALPSGTISDIEVSGTDSIGITIGGTTYWFAITSTE